MNTIKSFTTVITEDEESYFDCELDSDRRIQIHLTDFYLFAVKKDIRLKGYSNNFDEWEGLTNVLVELGYDFNCVLNEYLQQFNEQQLDEFTY